MVCDAAKFRIPLQMPSSQLSEQTAVFMYDGDQMVSLSNLTANGNPVFLRTRFESSFSQSYPNCQTMFIEGYLEGNEGARRVQFLKSSIPFYGEKWTQSNPECYRESLLWLILGSLGFIMLLVLVVLSILFHCAEYKCKKSMDILRTLTPRNDEPIQVWKCHDAHLKERQFPVSLRWALFSPPSALSLRSEAVPYGADVDSLEPLMDKRTPQPTSSQLAATLLPILSHSPTS
ncbi:unnamed protein product [Darwinula stevensoni]|uniref:Uncharacterized protein n=1 Tax=Darwinula stevensoni TaxID=69355 RepID=A0A7R9FPF8_9CRUS|nr:unnamed protein product [Darwinula stevensoni]CAG0897877.1 unnamed protein product [Darwinula stevensoni]